MNAAIRSTEELRRDISEIVEGGSPQVSAFAAWVLDNYQEVAFRSLRAAAGAASVNPNSAVRLAKALGYAGYDSFRADIQSALRENFVPYSKRAHALTRRSGADTWESLRKATNANLAAAFSPGMRTLLATCAQELVTARRIYCIGVRSCFSLAHYFTYVGAMAFANIVHTPNEPGGIMDMVSQAGPRDIVIAITYAHYSWEVVRGVTIANECGARVIALTDSMASPVARGAWKVVPLPMAGPHLIPSLAPALSIIELLLAEMVLRAPDAERRVHDFEERIKRFRGYVLSDPTTGR
ncbi:RpiR family transcriptional regulator [Breoghania corrubedonensis]|uniref:RpiR family transcriptional regulator n=1 Tax=Breoghania corrubedonensis TaxID=665038 RepID=A0A2T5V5M0_9HYPH|nr:MurR/RpiR family transcriptional regulator [Breoghania corrubedonensis]PTW59040.1 RpiR family transcriptional regulator [Breoghania corrubedonensis]